MSEEEEEKSTMERLYQELDTLKSTNDQNAQAWRHALGNQILDIAESGMSSVGGPMFNAVFRNEILSSVYWGVDLAQKADFICTKAPALFNKIRGFLK